MLESLSTKMDYIYEKLLSIKKSNCFLLQITPFCVHKCSFIVSDIRELAKRPTEAISLCFGTSMISFHI